MTQSPHPLSANKIRRAISTERLGKKIHCFETIPSTNVEAQSLAKKGAAEGEIVIAEGQTQGKGRLGRGWVSPPYLNLYLSVILRPKLPPSLAPQITLMSAVALAETVQSFLSIPPEIKWPNDILVGGKKLAGVLTESSCEPDRVLFVVVGIGVNLNFPRELMPESIQETATSILILTQKPVDRSAFTCRLIQSLDQCYGELESSGFASIAQRWDSFFRLRGKSVRVEMPDESVSGRVVGIDTDGALILVGEGGDRERIVAGDVFPLSGSD
ncbi:MAG: biotin--[acetyl-CoA-carboxylase] ligase [Candidatus Binatia bacterium]